ncbi:zinc-type alcohol dehydrogenase-like protein [Umbelopsis sp. PMI_123]|nr:zinc-type alcohol dehydrogenase-like protein [Umbelopsis sp. PMI_123]
MMNALRITKDTAGSAATSLSVTKVPIPQRTPGSLLVKIYAAAINPSDVLNASGGFPHTTFPRIPGRDFAGVIVESDSAELIGQRVLGTSGNSLSFSQDGAHAEYCIVTANSVALMPGNLTFSQASSIGTPFTTAFIALERAQTTSTNSVLVLGASGAVGSAAVQSSNTDINTPADPQLTKVNELTDGHGVDIVIDTVGDPALMRAALDVLAVRGRISYIAAPRTGSTEGTFDMKNLYRTEQSIIGCSSLKYTIDEMGDDERLIKVGLGNDALDAYAKIKSRAGGKYIITFL